MSEHTYRLFHAAGAPRELGRAHGEKARDRICGILDYLRASLKLPAPSLRAGSRRFEPLFQRMQELLGSRLGRLTVEDLKRFLSDHSGHPTSICRHPHDGVDDPILPSSGRTAASLIAEADRGVLHVSRGNPCQTEYVAYRLFD